MSLIYLFTKIGRRTNHNDKSRTKKQIPNVQTGIFGADMQVSLVNDGPVTIILEKE